MNLFTIKYHPEAKDGAVWTVYSPEGVSVHRTDDPDDAITERDRRNVGRVMEASA